MKKSLILTLFLIFVCASVSFARTVQQYYPNGTTQSIMNYNEKGELNGVYKLYWPNGKLKEIKKFKNGQRIGRIKRYSSAGVLLGK